MSYEMSNGVVYGISNGVTYGLSYGVMVSIMVWVMVRVMLWVMSWVKVSVNGVSNCMSDNSDIWNLQMRINPKLCQGQSYVNSYKYFEHSGFEIYVCVYMYMFIETKFHQDNRVNNELFKMQ